MIAYAHFDCFGFVFDFDLFGILYILFYRVQSGVLGFGYPGDSLIDCLTLWC